MDWIKILIEISSVLGVASFVMGLSNDKYRGFEIYFYFLYSISGVFFVVGETADCMHESSVSFGIMYIAIILYFINWIIKFFGHKKRLDSLLNSKLKGATPITWENLYKQRVDSVKEIGIAIPKKLYQSKEKMVFESEVKNDNNYYFSDFTKEYHVMAGSLKIIFKTGEIEYLSGNEKTIIRPYEVHKLEPNSCKLLVTCLK